MTSSGVMARSISVSADASRGGLDNGHFASRAEAAGTLSTDSVWDESTRGARISR